MVIAAALLLAAAGADQRLATGVALYERLCLAAFPDDAALDRAVTREGAAALSPADTKITLGADPGRGWQIERDGVSYLVFLELPPYHACSVRFPMPNADYRLDSYDRAITSLRSSGGDLLPIQPFDTDQGDLHIHATGRRRQRADGMTESLFVIDQHVTDITRRAAGETGVMLRFVRQIAPAEIPQ